MFLGIWVVGRHNCPALLCMPEGGRATLPLPASAACTFSEFEKYDEILPGELNSHRIPPKLNLGGSKWRVTSSVIYSFAPFILPFSSLQLHISRIVASQTARTESHLHPCLFLIFKWILPTYPVGRHLVSTRRGHRGFHCCHCYCFRHSAVRQYLFASISLRQPLISEGRRCPVTCDGRRLISYGHNLAVQQ